MGFGGSIGSDQSAIQARLRSEEEQRRLRVKQRAAEQKATSDARIAEQKQINANRQRQQQTTMNPQPQAPRAPQAVAPVFGGAPAGGIAAAAAPGASTMGGGVMGGGIQSNVTPDPNIAKWEQERQDRLEGLKTPTDTSRLEGMAATGIAGAAAGQQAQLDEQIAARGLGGGAGDVGGQLTRGISEAAQSDQARAQAEIAMNAENQRQNEIRNTLGLGSQFAGQAFGAEQEAQRTNIGAFGAQTARTGVEGNLALGAYGAETQRGLGTAGIENEQERLRQQQLATWASLMGQYNT